jgi:hypothetical protein
MVWSKEDQKAVERAALFNELHTALRKALGPEVLAAIRLMVVTEMVRNGVSSAMAEGVVAKKEALTIEFSMGEPR